MKLEVTAGYTAKYADPIAVTAGEVVVPGKRDAEHPGWIWCVDPRGKGGWTPEPYLERTEERWVCTRDYDGRELAVAVGDLLDRVDEHAGWTLCRSPSGETGWVPAASVRAAPSVRSALFVFYVREQAASASFYRQVLAAEPILDVPGMTSFSLGSGGELGLMPESGIQRLLDGAVDPARGSGVARAELYLTVEDPAAYHARALAAGARELSPLAPRGWGDAAAYSQDPDGHVLVFARKLDGASESP